MIDTHSAVKKLQSGGFNEQQAEVLVFVVNDLSNQTVTKAELSSELGKVSTELKAEIQEVRNELKAEIQDVRNELKAEIQGVRNELKLEIQRVRNEIQEVRSDIQSLSQNFSTNMRWMFFMFATMVTLFIAPVVSNIIKFW